MKTENSSFDTMVAQYYPAVYGLAARLTEDPRQALAFTRSAFDGVRNQLEGLRNRTSIANVLLSAVLRAALAAA